MWIGVWQTPFTYCSDNWSAPLWPFRRATVKKGVTFRTATPTNSLLWDITLDMGADGVISVVCQRKAAIPGKRQVFFLNGCVSQLSSLLYSHIISILIIIFQTMQLRANISLLWGTLLHSQRTSLTNQLQVGCRCSGKVALQNLYKIICIIWAHS